MSTQLSQSDNAAATLSRAGKYLTFFLAGEEYGLEILKVSEIIVCSRSPGCRACRSLCAG